jgi:hypothetical protein
VELTKMVMESRSWFVLIRIFWLPTC